jgi:glycosyltransferase involved in cell wall biosynthesis
MIRLLALVQKRPGLSPGQRFRLEQWSPLLEAKHGIRIDFEPFESTELTDVLYRPGHKARKAVLLVRDTLRRRRVLGESRKYDGIVIYREAAMLGPAIYERLLTWLGVPIFMDFDDAIWFTTPAPPNGVFSYLRFASKAATICRLSRAVIVGNQYLASYARQFSSNVHVVPTSIELRDYPVQPPIPPEPFTVVWSGSLSTLSHLEEAREPIETLGKQRHVVLRVIANKPPPRPFANVENVFIPWSAKGEAETLGRAHVGIMPLPDDKYTRGKCALKALQYMAVGVPALVSPVGVNTDVIQHGKNGLLASSTSEWLDSLYQLAHSPELRSSLGVAGRQTVEAKYSSIVAAATFAHAVRTSLAITYDPPF